MRENEKQEQAEERVDVDARVAEIEARWNDVAEAFPGPWWEVEPTYEDEEPEAVGYDWNGVEAEIASIPSANLRGAVIAAVDDVPWLCQQLREARAALTRHAQRAEAANG